MRSDSAPGTDVRFKDYLLENVYLRTTQAQRAEIIALWAKEGAVVDPQEAARRSHEAVVLVRASSGGLAGLSTVGLTPMNDGRTFYAYRMFLRSRDRVPGLFVAVNLATRDLLRNFRHPTLQPAGMLFITENSKLMRLGARKLIARNGYQYWGKTSRDEDVWGVEFAAQDKSFERETTEHPCHS